MNFKIRIVLLTMISFGLVVLISATAAAASNVYYVATNGNDNNPGTSLSRPFRTIQKCATVAVAGDTCSIRAGTYRETVTPAYSGTVGNPITFTAYSAETVVIRGSEPSSSLVWTQLTANTIGLPPGVIPSNVYSADLSAWNLTGPPRFIVELDGSGQVIARLPLARAPNWNVVTDWKYQEFWWAADGGASPAACNPATDANSDCDMASRSTTQLTDRTNDTNPPGVEAGNLTTLGDLTGATLVAIDTVEGHYVYRRTIIAHDVAAGRITVDKPCEVDSSSGNPGLGWGSKYYVEGKPYLLDTPGEWWYDSNRKRLYLWPPTPGNPASKNIEISRRENGFSLQDRSYITLDGLTIKFLNGSAVYQVNGTSQKSYGNKLNNLTLHYADFGVSIQQTVAADAPPGNVIEGFTVDNSEIAYMDNQGINLGDNWEGGSNPDLFTHSGVRNTTITHNELHHLGFRADGDNAIGLRFDFANQLRFEGNHVHDIAHNGVQFSKSVIQSSKVYGFNPSEIKTGDILVKDNLFERACQLTTDCGGLKIWGSAPNNHVYRNFLITGNVFRDNFGWTYISEQRQRWTGGANSEVRGMGGFGLYVDNASGIHAYRNISYNNAYANYMIFGWWRDGEIVYVNNLAANSLFGIRIDGVEYDTHGSVNTQLINNILLNNEGVGLSLSYAAGRYANMTVDHNLYFNNGWRPYAQGGRWDAGAFEVVQEGNYKNPYPTLVEVQANTPWEDHGLEGNPAFWSYDLADHELHDGSRPDFHLTAASANAIDQGTTTLPASLTALLGAFGVVDYRLRSAYDIGRYEGGFLLLTAPTTQVMDPGSTVRYRLSLFPPDIPYPVGLSTTNPPPNLITLNLSPSVITGAQTATLTVTDAHTGPLIPGMWYIRPITSTGGGFTNTTSLGLLVGGTRIYLPMMRR